MVMCYMDIPYPCPFIEGKESLSDEFGRAVYEAWQMLIKDSAIMDLVIQDSRQRRMRESCSGRSDVKMKAPYGLRSLRM